MRDSTFLSQCFFSIIFQKVYWLESWIRGIHVKTLFLFIIKLSWVMYKKTESIFPSLRQRIESFSYANKQPIGKGFSSSVYRGRNDTTDEQVAIKVIDMKTMKGDVHRTLLASQIQILSMMKNKPNILDVQQIYADKNKTYIITDFCEGGDLNKFIKSKKKLSESQSIKIIKQIIKGYESLYSLGIIHRDLKPANIFFRNSESQIGDFGFAIKQEKLLSAEKYNVGSPIYMSPQALISNKYSHKSDIWSIGVIFFEMLTGNTPWSGRTETELKSKIKTIPIKSLLPQGISKTSTVFLLKSLQTDPKRRMDITELFSHFNGGCQYYNTQENDLNEKNRVFRSMRKTKKNLQLEKNRGQSLKKPSNQFGVTRNKNEFKQSQIPRTAMESKNLDKEYLSSIQKRKFSKQLLNQVHFCRFMFKLIIGIQSKLHFQIQNSFKNILQNFLFCKLNQIKELKLIDKEHAEEYQNFGDYKKLRKLVEEYEQKYKRKLHLMDEQITINEIKPYDYETLLALLIREILNAFDFISEYKESTELLKEVVILDYMITFKQLLQLMKDRGIEQFSIKSKIQAIVEGEVIDEVSEEHVKMIKDKLKALRII